MPPMFVPYHETEQQEKAVGDRRSVHVMGRCESKLYLLCPCHGVRESKQYLLYVSNRAL